MQDKYILFSMIMLGTICVWHAILPAIHSVIDSDGDLWALLAFSAFFILAHVTFFVIIYAKVSVRTVATTAVFDNRDAGYTRRCTQVYTGVFVYHTLTAQLDSD